jgi:hypothetical protein
MTKLNVRIVSEPVPKRPGIRTSDVVAVTNPGHPTWLVSFDYEVRNKRRVAVGIHIVAGSKHPDVELTTANLWTIPASSIFDEWLRSTGPTRTIEITPKVIGPKKGGPLSIDLLRKVADLYREALDQGLPPNQHVADRLGISRSTATKRIMRARQAGYLGPTTPGKQGESTI